MNKACDAFFPAPKGRIWTFRYKPKRSNTRLAIGRMQYLENLNTFCHAVNVNKFDGFFMKFDGLINNNHDMIG